MLQFACLRLRVNSAGQGLTQAAHLSCTGEAQPVGISLAIPLMLASRKSLLCIPEQEYYAQACGQARVQRHVISTARGPRLSHLLHEALSTDHESQGLVAMH